MVSRAAAAIVILLFLAATGGCTSGSRGDGPAGRPAIDDTKWERVLDRTYVLGPPASGNESAEIPVSPGTAYRLDTRSGAPLELSLYPDNLETGASDGTAGGEEGDVVTFASRVVAWNGIIRTGPGQTRLGLRRIHSRGGPAQDRTLQDVRVVLDRYDGDPSIEPVTTQEEVTYSPR